MFYHFSQNNSGGLSDFDKERGITHHVIVEAESPESANARAEKIGLYFNGVVAGRDCKCCGDRWNAQWNKEEGDLEPSVYGQPVANAKHYTTWMDKGYESVVHYADGTFKFFA